MPTFASTVKQQISENSNVSGTPTCVDCDTIFFFE